MILKSLISVGYIFGFRKDKVLFFNILSQNHPSWDILKESIGTVQVADAMI
jgi:hypothetical protein